MIVPKRRTFLHDAVDFVALGVGALKKDDFGESFVLESSYDMAGSGFFYGFSFVARYFILFPIRMILLLLNIFLFLVLFALSKIINSTSLAIYSLFIFNKVFINILNFRIKNYGIKRRMDEPHVYVANHTSYIDYMILSSHKFIHACVAEAHGGVFGFILNKILVVNGSIGFKRSDKQDRLLVHQKVKDHICKNKSPMLIFPEGTCVNNRRVLLFQKGAFDLDVPIIPVAIKYSKELCEPYWHRRMHGFILHFFYFLTRWKLDVNVYWMDPVSKKFNESSVEFAHRVKLLVARKARINNSLWNGYFKSSPVLHDRNLLLDAFIDVYSSYKQNDYSQAQRFPIYLRIQNFESRSENTRIYFGVAKYKTFINECCQKYLYKKEFES